MSQVFISYRRDDSADVAGRIYDRLVQCYGRDNVFKDVDDIPLGLDFRQVIGEAVGRCQVLLAVIGRQWLDIAGPSGGRRLDDPNDFVRQEIEAALRRGIPVIPVLVNRAAMPAEGQFPESLQPLAFRNGIAVRWDPDFDHDMDRLLNSLARSLQGRTVAAGSQAPSAFEARKASRPVQSHQPQPGEVVANSLGMKFAWIPRGTFHMGSLPSEGGWDDETQHRVTLTRGFWLGVYPVTQAQWCAVMGRNPSRPSRNQGDELPVINVSWDDCQEFCKTLTVRDGKLHRLPTEAEREYACRAGTTTPFSFGEVITTEQANYDGNHTYGSGKRGENRREMTRVGIFPPNAWGLYDMHGNVREWCADWYGKYSNAAVRDPAGPETGSDRVIRGGSWNSSPRRCRSAARGRQPPGDVRTNLGVRVVLCLD
jgi:formylglycine-generating enzyme required for sulfatase activity